MGWAFPCGIPTWVGVISATGLLVTLIFVRLIALSLSDRKAQKEDEPMDRHSSILVGTAVVETVWAVGVNALPA